MKDEEVKDYGPVGGRVEFCFIGEEKGAYTIHEGFEWCIFNAKRRPTLSRFCLYIRKKKKMKERRNVKKIKAWKASSCLFIHTPLPQKNPTQIIPLSPPSTKKKIKAPPTPKGSPQSVPSPPPAPARAPSPPASSRPGCPPRRRPCPRTRPRSSSPRPRAVPRARPRARRWCRGLFRGAGRWGRGWIGL